MDKKEDIENRGLKEEGDDKKGGNSGADYKH